MSVSKKDFVAVAKILQFEQRDNGYSEGWDDGHAVGLDNM